MPSRDILTREVTEKLRLEAILKPGIRKIFSRVVSDFRISVAHSGRPQDAGRYKALFESLLDEHYRRVQKSFSGAILLHNSVKSFKDLFTKAAKPNEDEARKKELMLAIFLLWREKHAPEQADFIVATTVDDMNNAIDQGRQVLVNEGKPIDKRSLAVAAAAILRRILHGRIDLIAVTETQTAAETTKAVEASVVSDTQIPGIPVPSWAPPDYRPKPSFPASPTPRQPAEPEIPEEPETFLGEPLPTLKKTWITLRDKRVRMTHSIAYGQTRLINEAFAVGGSSMMFPGDGSLGAPVRELAHCRCSAQYKY